MDLLIEYNQEQDFWDIAIQDGQLSTTDSIENAVILSLGTDKRVNIEELPFEHNDQRGWWGDILMENHEIGSKLWLLKREKITENMLENTENYAREALVWLVSDGIVKSIDVQAVLGSYNNITILVNITLLNNNTFNTQYSFKN